MQVALPPAAPLRHVSGAATCTSAWKGSPCRRSLPLRLRLPPRDCVSTPSSTVTHTVLCNGSECFRGATDQRFGGQGFSSCRGLPVSIVDTSSPSSMMLTACSVLREAALG
ncbi:uncharacterized protein LAESUDRAFT_457467 [Laetiporus sulphureus 93-53]|uniref:Uncharacterized protein n=1 Tax=Laetiporus sulphureus 93-53 TaxID=1314785 RepID=A0A165BR85_9APHY|nr:uncharacterized protein LAESUDRAFT_457467 [Laetiporus sulphureus 93-53]KZT01506.1 hypothetical protein LAESUDRAFT_457467 [Laetiporus sulphureus 93-53]